MESLLPLMSNLSLQWIWLSHHLSSINSITVYVFCFQTCETDALFQTFTFSNIPWTSRYNADEFSPVLHDETVLILTSTPEETKLATLRASRVFDAFRARYILVQDRYVDENGIKALGKFAWAKRLTQVIVVRLEDSAIYAVFPNCQESKVTGIATVQWPDFQKADLSNCILKIGIGRYPPFWKFAGGNDSYITGTYEPFYRYAKAALNFQAVLTPASLDNASIIAKAGIADMTFCPVFLAANALMDITTMHMTKMVWCVPDSCVLGTTTYFLWREFDLSTWSLLIVSVVAVSVTVWRLTTAESSSLIDSVFMVISTLASNSGKFPEGHARGVIVGWVIAVLVLSTLYQSVLHSMMAAPLIIQEIEDMDALLKSRIKLICGPSICTVLKKRAAEDMLLAQLAARTEVMDPTVIPSFLEAHPGTAAAYIPNHLCKTIAKMRELTEEGTQPAYFGVFAVLRSSWFAPALREIAGRLEASGLAGRWFQRDVKRHICSSPADRELQPITVALLWPAVLLLCCGLAFSLIAFLVEMWWSCFRRNRHQSNQNHGN